MRRSSTRCGRRLSARSADGCWWRTTRPSTWACCGQPWLRYEVWSAKMRFLCSWRSRAAAGRSCERHSLDALAREFGISFRHHNAEEDAMAAALVVLRAAEEYSAETVEELLERTGFRFGEVAPGAYLSCRRMPKKSKRTKLVYVPRTRELRSRRLVCSALAPVAGARRMCGVRQRNLFCQRLADAARGFFQGFRQDASFGDHAHEVGVGHPARQHVHVDVSGDTGSGGLADVHSQIDAIRAIELAEHAFQALGQEDHLGRGLGGQQVQAVHVLVGDDHDVAGGVREGVDDDEAVRAAIEDEIALIVLQVGLREGARSQKMQLGARSAVVM